MPAKNKKPVANIKGKKSKASTKKAQLKPKKKVSAAGAKKPVKKLVKTVNKKKAVAKKAPVKSKRAVVSKRKTAPKVKVGVKSPLKEKTTKAKVAVKKAVSKVSKASKVKKLTRQSNKKSTKNQAVKRATKSMPKKATQKVIQTTKPASRVANKKTVRPAVVSNKNRTLQKPSKVKSGITTHKFMETDTSKDISIPAITKKAVANATALVKRTKRPGSGPAGFLPYDSKAGEEYMSDKQLAHFQHILHLWKEQLYADREATTQHMRDDTINFPDPLDRAALEEEHTLEWRAREREHRLITKIDQALVSMKQGDYGYCEACGAEIGIRRLEARPTATQCIDCKTIDEIRERHTGTVE